MYNQEFINHEWIFAKEGPPYRDRLILQFKIKQEYTDSPAVYLYMYEEFEVFNWKINQGNDFNIEDFNKQERHRFENVPQCVTGIPYITYKGFKFTLASISVADINHEMNFIEGDCHCAYNNQRCCRE